MEKMKKGTRKTEKGKRKRKVKKNLLLVGSTQLLVNQRMNANGVRYQMIYFPETDNTIKRDSCYGYNVRLLHNAQ
jgi:hypothetical protein